MKSCSTVQEEGGCLSFRRKGVADTATALAAGANLGGGSSGVIKQPRESRKRGTESEKRFTMPNRFAARATSSEDPNDSERTRDGNETAESGISLRKELDKKESGYFGCMRFFTERTVSIEIR